MHDRAEIAVEHCIFNCAVFQQIVVKPLARDENKDRVLLQEEVLQPFDHGECVVHKRHSYQSA